MILQFWKREIQKVGWCLPLKLGFEMSPVSLFSEGLISHPHHHGYSSDTALEDDNLDSLFNLFAS